MGWALLLVQAPPLPTLPANFYTARTQLEGLKPSDVLGQSQEEKEEVKPYLSTKASLEPLAPFHFRSFTLPLFRSPTLPMPKIYRVEEGRDGEMEWTEEGRGDEGKRNQKYTTRLSRAQPNMSKKRRTTTTKNKTMCIVQDKKRSLSTKKNFTVCCRTMATLCSKHVEFQNTKKYKGTLRYSLWQKIQAYQNLKYQKQTPKIRMEKLYPKDL